MTGDIVVGRCKLEVIRRDAGAIWADRDSNLDIGRRVQAMVIGALDQWLAPLLEQHDARQEDIAELSIALTLDEGDLSGGFPLLRTKVRKRVATALAAADIVRAEASRGKRSQGDAGHGMVEPPGEARSNQAPLAREPASRVWPGLLAAFREGRLLAQLALLKPLPLCVLAARVISELAVDSAEREPIPDAAQQPLEYSERTLAAARALRGAIGALAVAASLDKEGSANGPSSDPKTAAALEQMKEAATSAASALNVDMRKAASARRASDKEQQNLSPEQAEAAAGRDTGNLPGPSPRSHAKVSQPSNALPLGRHHCPSLLAFLLLQPLAQHDLLDGIAADARDTAFLAHLLGHFAGAGRLADDARKIGLRLFAGMAREATGQDILAAALRSRTTLEIAAAQAGAALLAGHREGLPLLAMDTGGKLLVAEREGMAPLALLSKASLRGFADQCDAPLLVLGGQKDDLDRIDEAGFRFLAAGAPGRAERWSQVRGPRGWVGTTNMGPAAAARTARHAAGMEDVAAHLEDVWRSLHDVTLPVAPPVEHRLFGMRAPLALLAGFSLSEIGLSLARLDEAGWCDPDPLLVADRFASLSGELVVEEERVVVTLPLGRRFTDLRDAGLLRTIRGVPWWPQRQIEFAGG